MNHPSLCTTSSGQSLRFRSLFPEGRGYTFPCDERGHVVLDALTQREMLSYLYARTLIGREFSTPFVEAQMA